MSNGSADVAGVVDPADAKTEPGAEARLEVRTGEVSGIRSAPAGRSVPAVQDSPGPIGAALKKLYRDVEHDATVVNRFVNDYLQLMHERVNAILRLLALGDYDALVVSILSLETTSAMIGAGELVTVAKSVRTAVEERQLDVATDLLELLSATVTSVKSQLAREGFAPARAKE